MTLAVPSPGIQKTAPSLPATTTAGEGARSEHASARGATPTTLRCGGRDFDAANGHSFYHFGDQSRFAAVQFESWWRRHEDGEAWLIPDILLLWAC